MNWCILMSLFESVVFSNHMEIISSDDDSSGHLSGNDNTSIITLSHYFISFMYLMILPLMETSPVKGHFLSMYVPWMASWGVLKPRPMFLKYLSPLAVLEARIDLLLREIPACLWKVL